MLLTLLTILLTSYMYIMIGLAIFITIFIKAANKNWKNKVNGWKSDTVNFMHPELKTLWIAALRSGKYKQDVGFTEFGGHCPLGVLAKVLKVRYSYLERNAVEFGIGLSIETNLTYLNDHEEMTFAEIANWIESNIQTLDYVRADYLIV